MAEYRTSELTNVGGVAILPFRPVPDPCFGSTDPIDQNIFSG